VNERKSRANLPPAACRHAFPRLTRLVMRAHEALSLTSPLSEG
jgi:hypothetical protein